MKIAVMKLNDSRRRGGFRAASRRALILTLPVFLALYCSGCCALKKKDAGNPFDGPTPAPASPCDQTPPTSAAPCDQVPPAQPAGSGSVPVIMPNNGGEAPPGSVVTPGTPAPSAPSGSVGLFEKGGGESQRSVSANESAPAISEAHYEKQDSAAQTESGLFLAPGESAPGTAQSEPQNTSQNSPQMTPESGASAQKPENQAAPFEKGAIPEGFNDYSNKEKPTGVLQPVSEEKTPNSDADHSNVDTISGANPEKTPDTTQKAAAPIAPIEIPAASDSPEPGGPVAATDQVQFRTVIEK